VNGPDQGIKSFLTACKKAGQYKGNKFQAEVTNYCDMSFLWEDTINDIMSQVASTPLLVVLGGYANGCSKYGKEGIIKVKLLEDLVSNIEIFQSDLKISDVKTMGMGKTLDLIRCERKWPYKKREAIVKEFLEFWLYVNAKSWGYIAPPYDPLKKIYSSQELSFKKFIEIMDLLSLRERTISELLYFGEDLNLNDVFTLDIQCIDFKNHSVHFKMLSENLDFPCEYYPKHVMQDLKDIVGKRKKGPVFLGKSGKAIDSTVPYRALKNAVHTLNRLDPTFSLKNFTELR